MSVAIENNKELLDGGPPCRLQRSLGLIKPDDSRIARRAQLAVLVGWAPLVVLAVVESLVLRNHVAASFFSDIAVHGRSLIAAPLLILAEADCLPRLGRVARQFVHAGLIRERDRARFDAAIASTHRLLDSKLAELIVVGLAYGLVLTLMLNIPQGEFPAWHQSEAGPQALSLAKWWHVLVSIPLLLLLLLGWLWRVILWGRFLWLTARLDLRLIPGHPDLAGGLMFVSYSLRGFWLLSFALGAIVAGPVANRVVHNGVPLSSFANVGIGLVALVLILFVGPIVVFMRRLIEARYRGSFEYGTLAGEVGQQFERKWLNRASGVDEGALDVPDFSSTTDLYQIVANAYEIKGFPIKLASVAQLIIASLLPFVPVLLMVMPLEEIIRSLAKLLM
jgi:hypothetical protein